MTQEEQNRLEEKLYSYGWSKGDYLHPKGCSLCLQPFVGSKRAYRCESCATKMMIDGVNLSILRYGIHANRDTIGGLIRQRDELHATTNRYLERTCEAEGLLFKLYESKTMRTKPSPDLCYQIEEFFANRFK